MNHSRTHIIAFCCVVLVGCGQADDPEEGGSTMERLWARELDVRLEGCACSWAAMGYADEEACREATLAEVSTPVNEVVKACSIEVFSEYESALEEQTQCRLVAVTRDLHCLWAARCDRYEIGACTEEMEQALNACPDLSADLTMEVSEQNQMCVDAEIVGEPDPVCPNETVEGLGEVLAVNTIGRGDDTSCWRGGSRAPDVTVAWTAPHSGRFRITAESSSFYPMVYALSECGGFPTSCASFLIVSLEAGQELVFAVDGAGRTQAGEVRVTIETFDDADPTTF